jgi:hypothetical protein
MDDKHVKMASRQNARIRRLLLRLGASISLAGLCSMITSVFRTPNHIPSQNPRLSKDGKSLKILYVVTTLSEYDSGARSTVKGFDRLQETLIPVVRESVESMIRSGFSVDVAIISHYNMTRINLLQAALPPSVGLQSWDDATPVGYKLEDTNKNFTQSITRALARQHRFLIKDKLVHYDFFAVFEDDMLITGDIVQNFIDVSDEINRLREKAPETHPNASVYYDNYHGTMTKAQLHRTIPGFIRVEVLLDEEMYGAQIDLGPVPVTDRPQIDPTPCCRCRNPLTLNRNRPADPHSDKLILWETNVKALGVRKMPVESTLDWVVLQRGPRVEQLELKIGDYWSGVDGYFSNAEDPSERKRPDTKTFRYINNQGGWMASKKQIWEWHESCPGGFLPPYEDPEYHLDGLDKRNVEFWSGGLSLFTKEHGCNFQRIISLEPHRFARSLLYHTANNKQRQFQTKREFLVKVNDFWGQLNTVRKHAEEKLQGVASVLTDKMH